MEDLRDAIDEAICSSGLKRKVVAVRAGLTPQQLTDITKKRRHLDAHEMINICRALNITADQLLTIATNNSCDTTNKDAN